MTRGELDARWRAHVLRLLSQLLVQQHAPAWTRRHDAVRELIDTAEEIARAYDEEREAANDGKPDGAST